MAGELPYFKFYTSEWREGNITLCSLEAQGVFINLCAMYWLKKGHLSYAIAMRRYSDSIIQELREEGIFQVEGDKIVIRFLDEQLADRKVKSEIYRLNAQKRWSGDATVEQPESNSNAIAMQTDAIAHIREEKRREEKRKEEKRGEVKEKTASPSSPPKTKSGTGFQKPGIDEVKDYFFLKTQDMKLATWEAEKFYDFYESKGWMVGKNKMKIWKSAINNWLRKDDKSQDKNGTDKFSPENVKSRMERW